MEKEVKILRDQGKTWKEVAQMLKVSITTARKYYEKEPTYPKTYNGWIYRKVINPRLMLVQIEDGNDNPVVPAVVRQGLHYPQGKPVKVEQIDEKHYRVV